MYNAIISTVVRDDEPYYDEWIDYHSKLGFEHFVIHDHRSIVPLQNRWGDKVTIIRQERYDVTFPILFHNETLANFKCNWLGVLDVDEFIVLFQHRDIYHLLSNYEDTGGLAINWSVYGSSGHITRPEGLVKDNYVWRMPNDLRDSSISLVNTIIKANQCTHIHNPHTALCKKHIVTEDHEICDSALANSSRTLCRINHYITRSQEDWNHKVDRANRAGCGHMYGEQGIRNTDKDCTVYDDWLVDYGTKKYWETIEGWFNFHNLYTDMVGKFNDAIFVEVGAWKGKSSVFMAEMIKKSGRNIKFFVVDIWEPFTQSGKLEEGVKMEDFLTNIEPVKDYITPIKGNSLEVASQFFDYSIDFLFLDASHDYEHMRKELEVWTPKVKGIIAGHDYMWGGVEQAVKEKFENVKLIPNTTCWLKSLL